jgi:hypothetical protein
MKPSVVSLGDAPKLDAVKVVALYEPKSGKIVHLHTIATFKGARAASEEEAIKRATAHASHIGHAVDKLKVKVSSNLEHATRPHRIDPKTLEFLPVEVQHPVKKKLGS